MTDSGAPFRRYLRFLRPDIRADIDDELDFHLAMRTRDMERAGHGENAARKRPNVATLILSQGSRLAFVGITVGLVVAFALRGVVKQLLYGVQPFDLLTFTVVPIVLVLVAILASLIPALRATRVDPAVAMRAE